MATAISPPPAQLQEMFKEVVENIFNRWTALRLAVEHGMGGPLGLNTAIEIINYVTCFCTENKRVDFIDLREVLEEIMDQEFQTICQDESIDEISHLLIKFLNLLRSNKVDELRAELARMGPCEIWIKSGNRIKVQKMDDSSGTEDEEDDDDDDDEMEVEAPPFTRTVGMAAPVKLSTEGSTTDFVEEEIDPGWTQVRNRRRRIAMRKLYKARDVDISSAFSPNDDMLDIDSMPIVLENSSMTTHLLDQPSQTNVRSPTNLTSAQLVQANPTATDTKRSGAVNPTDPQPLAKSVGDAKAKRTAAKSSKQPKKKQHQPVQSVDGSPPAIAMDSRNEQTQPQVLNQSSGQSTNEAGATTQERSNEVQLTDQRPSPLCLTSSGSLGLSSTLSALTSGSSGVLAVSPPIAACLNVIELLQNPDVGVDAQIAACFNVIKLLLNPDVGATANKEKVNVPQTCEEAPVEDTLCQPMQNPEFIHVENGQPTKTTGIENKRNPEKPLKAQVLQKAKRIRKEKKADENRKVDPCKSKRFTQTQFMCEICQKCYKTKAIIEEHIVAVHSSAAPQFECGECGKLFKRRSVRSRHERGHQRLFSCEECQRSFTQNTHLIRHLKTKHMIL